jgi:hypothetical protein
VRYTRAVRTSHFHSCSFDEKTGQIIARFTGKTDLLTHFYLFTGDGEAIDSTLVEVPVFDGQTDVAYRIP